MASSGRRNKVKKLPAEEYRGKVLAWYDRHKRTLPWRSTGKRKPDPYKVWLSEVMLQQTTVAAVGPYFTKFLKKWPDVESLARARSEEVMAAWAGLGYYARARNLHACAKEIAKRGGSIPKTQNELRELPGIGDYTSAAIAAIAFNQPATVVDGNVERVMARFYGVEEPLPGIKKHLKQLAHELSGGFTERPGDYAQAMMDLGATICIPKSPRCSLCPVNAGCVAFHKGNAAELPRRADKTNKPQKIGYVYWVQSGNMVLLQRRPQKGLLGGMAGLPTSDWIDREKQKDLRDWPVLKKTEATLEQNSVYHSFTHFDLQLIPKTARFSGKAPEGYFWCRESKLDEVGFPSLFKKAWRSFRPRRIL